MLGIEAGERRLPRQTRTLTEATSIGVLDFDRFYAFIVKNSQNIPHRYRRPRYLHPACLNLTVPSLDFADANHPAGQSARL